MTVGFWIVTGVVVLLWESLLKAKRKKKKVKRRIQQSGRPWRSTSYAEL